MPTGSSSRSWLFVPGDRPERFAKAGSSGADEVIVDLEDAVSPGSKGEARRHVAEWLDRDGSGWVRINAPHTAEHRADLHALARTAGLRGLVVPKAEAPEDLAAIEQELGRPIPLVALVETGVGVHRAVELATSGHAVRLAFGSIDYAESVGCSESDDALLLARSALVLASAVASLPQPIDGVTTTFREPAETLAAALKGKELGFGGKLCIHPAQVTAIHDAFRPSAREVAWAKRVLAASAGSDVGTASLDGTMIDKPVLARATRILSGSWPPAPSTDPEVP